MIKRINQYKVISNHWKVYQLYKLIFNNTENIKRSNQTIKRLNQ